MNDMLVEIKQDLPGYDRFIGSWIIKGKINFIIDVGPANTAGRLIESLSSHGLDRVDYILLSHIHIDHAGALAAILERYPMAKVIGHEKGIKYLIDPSKLWAGSLNVLGKIAEAYGSPGPVSEQRLIPHTRQDVKDLIVIDTPGHAPHHLSFCYRGRLYAGEAGGNYYTVKDKEYLRPATPPRFFMDVFLESIDKLLALPDLPIRYAHFGFADASHGLLKRFRDQLLMWKDIIFQLAADGPEDEDALSELCMDTLIEKDPNLRAISVMDPDTQNRERFFMMNSIKGFIGYYKEFHSLD